MNGDGGIALGEPTPIGEIIMTGITLGVLGWEMYNHFAKEEKCKEPCPPCNPPVGTIAYRIDYDHYHAGMKPHVHLYQMHQNPNDCRCFWKKLKVVAPPPPSGAIPMP